MPTIHEYPISVSWTGGRDGGGEFVAEHSGFKGPLNVGTEYQGPGGGTNPEELLTSAITACYTMTFGIIAQNRKLPVIDVQVKSVGEVEQNGPQLTYKSITVRPRITLDSSATPEQVAATEDMAHKADGYCIITNAVRGKVEIKVEPEIVKG